MESSIEHIRGNCSRCSFRKRELLSRTYGPGPVLQVYSCHLLHEFSDCLVLQAFVQQLVSWLTVRRQETD